MKATEIPRFVVDFWTNNELQPAASSSRPAANENELKRVLDSIKAEMAPDRIAVYTLTAAEERTTNYTSLL